MSKAGDELKRAGSAHVLGAWLFLAAALIAGAFGIFRGMSGATAGTAECCLGILFAVIAAVLALLGIHRQNTVLYDAIVPGYQGSHGSDDDSGGSV